MDVLLLDYCCCFGHCLASRFGAKLPEDAGDVPDGSVPADAQLYGDRVGGYA